MRLAQRHPCKALLVLSLLLTRLLWSPIWNHRQVFVVDLGGQQSLLQNRGGANDCVDRLERCQRLFAQVLSPQRLRANRVIQTQNDLCFCFAQCGNYRLQPVFQSEKQNAIEIAAL